MRKNHIYVVLTKTVYNKSRKEGITLAAILIFGKDTTIMSALPQHKTDMIFPSAESGQIR